MKNNKQTGFTLYELLITVLIVGVILALGIPNVRQFTQNSRMTSAANDLNSAFHLARSEASRAKATITICASANSMLPEANCGGTWEQGYIVFVDAPAGAGDIARTDPSPRCGRDGNAYRPGERDNTARLSEKSGGRHDGSG